MKICSNKIYDNIKNSSKKQVIFNKPKLTYNF